MTDQQQPFFMFGTVADYDTYSKDATMCLPAAARVLLFSMPAAAKVIHVPCLLQQRC